MITHPPTEDTILRAALRQHWHLDTADLHAIPMGDSAYSYRVDASGISYHLKVVDLCSVAGRRTAAHLRWSLPIQRSVGQQQRPHVQAPLPLPTITGRLAARQGAYLCALYTFIPGNTLAAAYPMANSVLQTIGQTLAALHSIALPAALQRNAPPDSLTLPWDDGLIADLAALEHITPRAASHLHHLARLIEPYHAQIRAFLVRGHDAARQALHYPAPAVLCHGDAWGGNLILDAAGRLTLLDWEAAVMAPIERDAFLYMGYMGEEFAQFEAGYRTACTAPPRWCTQRMIFYAYRLQLRNLAHWLHSALHGRDRAERADKALLLIEHHCLDRLDSVERTANAWMARSEQGYLTLP